MTVDKINVSFAIDNARKLLKDEKEIPSAVKISLELMITIVSLLVDRLNLNSSNSSIPPSKNPIGKQIRKTRKDKGVKRKQGAQKGHKGTTLKKVENPDSIEAIKIDKRTIPAGNYTDVGYDSRQVFDIEISLSVIEYRAQILQDDKGKQFVAVFPEGVSKAAQYGSGVKAHSVYMSQSQLIPQARVVESFESQMNLPVSKGSISNFNKEAYLRLEIFENWAKAKLIDSKLVHADETGINLNGQNGWLHSASNSNVVLFHADEKRGKEAIDRMGIIPFFSGFLVHDHWKTYYSYDSIHCLCNAHHLRELERAWEHDQQKWAKNLKKLLEKMNTSTKDAGGALPKADIQKYIKQYRKILKIGEKECPLAPKEEGKRGRQKQSKSRNLLTRLRDYEDDILRFMKIEIVPFTNNMAENDIRMTKVQQKVSGCFRSMNGAKYFCRIRSFLLTCKKNNISRAQALRELFEGKLPSFMD